MRSLRKRLSAVLAPAALFLAASCVVMAAVQTAALGPPATSGCSNCATWNAPQQPFRIYGNTFYVGPHGLSSILIQSDAGLVLIDGALPESAAQIAQHIRTLGFHLHDVKIILNTHTHFDHAGGIAELQRLSGAKVFASPWSATVLITGATGRADPQYGALRPIHPVAHVQTIHDSEAIRLGSLVLTAHFTPGHTPGGTTWTWQSCESGHCLHIVYADSLSAVSADNFKFSNPTSDPTVLVDFDHSFHVLDHLPCDILLTPHPDASDLWERLAKRSPDSAAYTKQSSPQNPAQNPLIDPQACRQLADDSRQQLQARLVAERAASSSHAATPLN